MHALEKILARASGREHIETGETVSARVDLAEVNDLYLQVLVSFREMEAKGVWDRDKVAFVLDHYAPAPTVRAAANQKEMREFVSVMGIRHLFDINAGICHQVLTEAGLVWPGELVVETDSHTTTLGAFGVFGTGCGATDMAAILATGEMWLRVPEIIRFNHVGKLPAGVFSKDLALNILGQYGTDVANYKAVEYAGECVDLLSLAQRMTLYNMTVEMGGKASYVQPDRRVLDYVKSRSGVGPRPVHTDANFGYAEDYTLDVSRLAPLVACPSRVDNVKPVSEVAGERIDQALIGTCTGGRIEDFETAAKILAGRRIPKDIRLLITPASTEVLQGVIDRGCLKVLMDAGATLVTPGCGACLGAHDGVLAPGERCITSSSRNFPGRMGSSEADIFVASPATVAASALEGRVADPRRYL